MDIVYILGTGSQWGDNELKYSLRSVEQNLKEYVRIFIVGEKPAFLNDNIIHIPYKDNHKNKQRNIHNKILAACECKEINDNFILFNDDYFIIKPMKLPQVPLYTYSEYLLDAVPKFKNNYKNHIEKTIQLLGNVKNYDTHYPITINKKKYIQINEIIDWEVTYGYLTRTLYVNRLPYTIFPVKITDKIINKVSDIEDKTFISCGNTILFGMKKYLENKFINPSKYERI